MGLAEHLNDQVKTNQLCVAGKLRERLSETDALAFDNAVKQIQESRLHGSIHNQYSPMTVSMLWRALKSNKAVISLDALSAHVSLRCKCEQQ